MPNSKTIGTIVRAARTLMELKRSDLAARLDITPGYLGHVERDDLVRVSERLAKALEKELQIPKKHILNLIDQHNVHVLRTYRLRKKTSA